VLEPANNATPSFGSDVAAKNSGAKLRAAVLHVPELTLKMSTKLLPTQSMLQRRQSTWKTTHTQTYPTKQRKLQGKSTQPVPEPPAKIATPKFGSDVAARLFRA
jgi:hypothetical protein